MKQHPVLSGIVPKPISTRVELESFFCFSELKTVSADVKNQRHAARLASCLKRFGQEPSISSRDDDAHVIFQEEPQLGEGAFLLVVTPHQIRVIAGTDAGFLYATGALTQVVTLAFAQGPIRARCECGEVQDAPAFGWRGFMLDSARHFQSVAVVRDVISTLAAYRINVLHLHLVDWQGWRIESELTSKMADFGELSHGQYSREDLREIARLAKESHIRIVPEIDMPGHQWGLITHYPELSCNPDNITAEFCITSEKVRTFLTAVLKDVIDIFPESTHLHLGGDEAGTWNWVHCPNCSARAKELGLTIRELEAKFMSEMCAVVRELGRTPICWSTDTPPPEGAVMQTWRSWLDVNAARNAERQIINSIHQNFYFDYPVTSEDPHGNPMPILDESGVYNSSVFHCVNPTDENATKLFLGVEACLWTERVPEWRVLEKITSRIAAFSEVAWTPDDQRDYDEFHRRRKALDAAAWPDLLRDGIL